MSDDERQIFNEIMERLGGIAAELRALNNAMAASVIDRGKLHSEVAELRERIIELEVSFKNFRERYRADQPLRDKGRAWLGIATVAGTIAVGVAIAIFTDFFRGD